MEPFKELQDITNKPAEALMAQSSIPTKEEDDISSLKLGKKRSSTNMLQNRTNSIPRNMQQKLVKQKSKYSDENEN